MGLASKELMLDAALVWRHFASHPRLGDPTGHEGPARPRLAGLPTNAPAGAPRHSLADATRGDTRSNRVTAPIPLRRDLDAHFLGASPRAYFHRPVRIDNRLCVVRG